MSTALSNFPDLVIRRHPRAKRMKLRYDAVEDRLHLTLPPRASEKKARAWLESQTEWIEKQRAGRAEAIPLIPNTQIPFRDGFLTLVHDPNRSRRLERKEDQLVGGGPAAGFSKRVEQWLRKEARDLLSDDVATFAALADVEIRGVSVGDARTRWGSCTHDGKLRFSWRLICAPDAVRRYVAAHEVAHRVHMDHGAAFHRLEEKLFGEPTDAVRRQLRLLGPRLQRIGR